ncbi:MAG: polynucleotide kinase-phosphatase, partial [Desulfovibrio sp.]|nr:polynucleotide kinase-phosphatase [Desulfovibrio sp.]
TEPAFEVLRYIAAKRLRFGKLAVVDATSVLPASRAPLVELAKSQDCLPVAIVLNMPEKLCQERNSRRADRRLPEHAVREHCRNLRRSLKTLKREGFRYLYVLNSPEEIAQAEIERQPLWTNRSEERGPFDIIGDVHGCFDELQTLLAKLGYTVAEQGEKYAVSHPGGRKLLFLGDVVDRGPKIADTLKFVMDACEQGSALCVCGNHEAKLLRKLNGKDVQVTHGLDRSVEELSLQPEAFSARVQAFLAGLISHFVLDGGRLVAAHAGMKEEYQGRASGRVRSFALYGDTTGESDEYGLPVRSDWASGYRGKALVVYGHTPMPEPDMRNNTLCIDTGCVFGGSLTACRYPERELVSVPAGSAYYEAVHPLPDKAADADAARDAFADLPAIEDVLGKRSINTRLSANIVIREENALAALETMSRFAVDPRRLIYLPPTMSPCETSDREDLLEHPREAFAYFRTHGIGKVVCEEKHMGSRAVVVVCRSVDAARTRFGVEDGSCGVCYTRTGRRFFEDRALETEFLERIQAQLERSSFWENFGTDWVCLDCELMPWSAKAWELIEKKYAATGAAGLHGLGAAIGAVRAALARGCGHGEAAPGVSGQSLDLAALLRNFEARAAALKKYVNAYRPYCRPVNGLEGVSLAPFHILATEGAVHVKQDHVWHMDNIARYCTGDDDLLVATPYLVVDTTSDEDMTGAELWWRDLTDRGGEGMVVKPYDFIATEGGRLLQLAVKCAVLNICELFMAPNTCCPRTCRA